MPVLRLDHASRWKGLGFGAAILVVSALVRTPAFAQSPTVPTVALPTVTVTAQKEPADARTLPVSVTVVTGATLRDAGILVKNVAAWHPLLANCLRITIGTPAENDALLEALSRYQ